MLRLRCLAPVEIGINVTIFCDIWTTTQVSLNYHFSVCRSSKIFDSFADVVLQWHLLTLTEWIFFCQIVGVLKKTLILANISCLLKKRMLFWYFALIKYYSIQTVLLLQQIVCCVSSYGSTYNTELFDFARVFFNRHRCCSIYERRFVLKKQL